MMSLYRYSLGVQKCIHSIIFVGILSLSSVATALPSHYPKQFSCFGSVNYINLDEGKLIVGDKIFKINSSVKVHYPKVGQSSNINSLSVGATVGCTGSASGRVSDLWMLSPPR